MRTKKALLNMAASAVLELVTVICGLIVPTLWIQSFGSEVYGTMSSITSIMGIIALGDAGVGSVIRVAMYKPLAQGDTQKLSSVWRTGKQYFSRLAMVFLAFVLAVAVFFGNKGELAVSSFVAVQLCLVIGAEYFIQYFFGYMNILVLTADQRIYVLNFIKCVSTVLNLGVILLLTGLSLPLIYVKTASILVYMLPPMAVYFYVNRRYRLDRKAPLDPTCLKQKWHGLALHISYYIQQNVDVLVLTFFSKPLSVAVYAIYNFVSGSLAKVISILYASIDSAFGNMLAKGEMDNLRKKFDIMQFFTFFMVTVMYTTAVLLLLPFVRIYTAGFDMAPAYIAPAFGYMLLLASALRIIRAPFQYLISAAGKFKQTMHISIIESVINIGLSIALVTWLDLVGVAIGTAVSVLYTTVSYAWFLRRNVIEYRFSKYLKLFGLSLAQAAAAILLLRWLPYDTIAFYDGWVLYGVVTVVIVLAVCVIGSLLFARKEFLSMWQFVRSLLGRLKKK